MWKEATKSLLDHSDLQGQNKGSSQASSRLCQRSLASSTQTLVYQEVDMKQINKQINVCLCIVFRTMKDKCVVQTERPAALNSHLLWRISVGSLLPQGLVGQG